MRPLEERFAGALDRLATEVLAFNAWMLGDNPSDVQAARSAGVVALAVRPLGIGAAGHTSRLIEAGADRLLDGIGELRRLLEELDDPA